MKGRIIQDWNNVDLKTPRGQEMFRCAINHFMQVPDTIPEVKAAIRHFTMNGDFPANVVSILQKWHVEPNFDEGWQEIYDVRDFTGTNASGFELLDVTSGLTFELLLPGEKVKIHKMSGSKVVVGFDMYGGGLGWLRQWFEDNQFWNIEDTTIQFANKWRKKRSEIFYALIEAVGSGQNITWQNPFPSTLPNTDANYGAVRDFETMNKAAETILLNLKDKGYGVGPSTEFIILHPIQLKSRVSRALSAPLNMNITGDYKGTQYNFRAIPTMMLGAADKYYVILPKQKIKAGIRMNLEMWGEFDIMSRTDVAVGYMRFGGAIGDEEQIQRCSIS
jgi:hypothetical protein